MTGETAVYAARAIRDFGDGFIAILLPVYLTSLGLSALDVGVVATLALLGSAILTLCIGLVGARHDHRHLLLAASALMAGTGVAYAASSDYWVLLLVAFVLALVGVKMLAHSWLRSLLGPDFNLYLLGAVLAILAAGVLASWLHRPRGTSSPHGETSGAAE